MVAKQKDRIHRYTEKMNSLEKALNAKEEVRDQPDVVQLMADNVYYTSQKWKGSI